MSFRYETHLHTAPVSKCAKVSVEESLLFYKEMGYDGVFITNHFIDGNINVDHSLPYEDRIRFYCSDYEAGAEVGEKIGLKVFFGVEMTYQGTDFLVYGLDKQWFLDHPEIEGMKKSEELALLMESGALVIQAHPYREADYIDHIRLFPRLVHGVEILNATQPEERNVMAELYAKHYGLLHFAGSDNHSGSAKKRLAGMEFDYPVESVEDFMAKIKNGEGNIFYIDRTAEV